MRRIKQAVIILIPTAVCLALAAASPADIIRPDLILEKMTQAVACDPGYVVFQQVRLDDFPCDTAVDQGTVSSETAWFKPPGRFRSEVTTNGIQRTYVCVDDRTVTVVDGKIVSSDEDPLMVYKDPLVISEPVRLSECLAALGVDLSVVSLGRIGETVAFVLGARYPDESVSQLWVDRESFLPLRLLLKKKPAGVSREVRYLDWRRETRVVYPFRIEIYQNGLIQRVLCVRRIQDAGPETDALFDVTALPAQNPMTGPGGVEARPDDKNGEVQRTIDDFRKLYQ